MRIDVRHLRRGARRSAPSTPVDPVVDTAELRWFAAGHAPAEALAWFTLNGTAGMVEHRNDTYRLDGRADVGVKRRFGETLELKVRRSVGAPLTLTAGVSGVIEEWRRWSPANGQVERADDESWIEVVKTVVKRRFSPTGNELVVSPHLPAGGGCDAEIAAISVGRLEAWSFALAGFGPAPARAASLTAGWRSLLHESAVPDSLRNAMSASSGYPEWLRRVLVTSPADPTRDDTLAG